MIPAEIPTSIADKIQQLSKNIFETLNLSGIARIDFLYQPETQELFANEINPMPGTLYHHLWKKSGVETGQLIQNLLDVAVHKHRETIKKNRYFSSSLLDEIKGSKVSDV